MRENEVRDGIDYLGIDYLGHDRLGLLRGEPDVC
jgi:hypothetical protein